MIRNSYGRWVNQPELYQLLGLSPTAHLPKEGFEKALRVGQRVTLYRCEPAGEPGRRVGKPQRVKFQCDCGRWIPFGRAGQHLAACERYQAHEAERQFAEGAVR
jgi:hypothetical protein